MSEKIAPDQAARDRIAQDLGTTLFVEAGAGSGKTTSLVARVVALVTTGAAELGAIAAITFTEKAGAELRDRVRRVLEERAAAEADPAIAQRCRTALDQLDAAAIGTLHSFAKRLLSENPIEAGLPPRVEVLDEVSSGLEFERRWTAFRDEMLADPGLEQTLLLLLAGGVRPEALKILAQAFDDNWDLVQERVPPEAPEPPNISELIEPVLDNIRAVCAEAVTCRDSEDKFCQYLGVILDFAGRMEGLAQLEILDVLDSKDPGTLPTFKVRGGKPKNWDDLADLKERLMQCKADLDSLKEEVTSACARRLGSAIRAFTLQAAAERRAAGLLEFHDLLVLSRSILRDPVHGATVRARLHGRYQRLLLDEFQDTDPIQIELAVRIAAAAPETSEAGAALWNNVAVGPGRLFVVGDPKQSIYRFRRADIGVFMDAQERFGRDGGGVVELTANFRTVGPVIDWVNHTFAALMPKPADDAARRSQPKYLALTATRPAPADGPPLSIIGRGPHPQGCRADQMRQAEAKDVAAAIVKARTEQWSVSDGNNSSRPARLGDITILIPARTSLPFLEGALEDAGVPYRAESSSLIYAGRAVRDLLMVLRAIDDPTNYLHIVSALRTPLLACGDDDLFRFKVECKGSWNYLSNQPETVPADDPVRAGLAYLCGLHDQRQWRSPSELLDRIARDRRAFELGFADGRPRDVWRRLRFIIDQARQWSEAAGGSLRQYLQWVELQSAEGARVAEAVLPETDDDAVRIMTIHAAKGLEFPITIVSGMSTAPQRRSAAAEVAFPPGGGVGYKFGSNLETPEYKEFKPIDEQMNHDERIRLLYVACTRAKDHLVVSLHRKMRANPAEGRSKMSNSELLLEGMGPLVNDLPDADAPDAPVLSAALVEPPEPVLSLVDWESEMKESLKVCERPSAVSATALKPDGDFEPDGGPDAGLQKKPQDLDLPPWLKGRYGNAIGRAVHGVLQTINLATGGGVEAAVAAQCEAEAVTDRAGDVRLLVDHALASPTVREAARCPHWREVYACTPMDDGRLLEGYIDLLYRGTGGLAVVDYKVASGADPKELDGRLEGYRMQGAAYALSVQVATDEPLPTVTFIFLTPEGPVERKLQDLEGTIKQIRSIGVLGAV